MLGIREPLKLTLRADFIQSNESFADRIIGNYRQLNEMIGPEDLLHVVTQPPEIFLMEGGGSMFVSESTVRNEQRNKVEIINNVVNRILLAADGHVTYQDEVYITNVLHKLGIHDDKTFMEQVFKLTQETKQTNKLLATYESNRESLTELISNYKTSQHISNKTEETVKNQEILHLHEDVFRRWMAGTLYEIQQNFRYDPENYLSLTKESYQIAEQGRLSKEIVLNQLREEVRGDAVPLFYRHENIYEGDDITNEDITEETVVQRLSAAVLLALTDNAYQSFYDHVDHNIENVFNIENALYQGGDSTFERVINNTSYRQSLYEQARNETNDTYQTNNEYELLQNILREDVRNSNYINRIEGDREFTEALIENVTENIEGETIERTIEAAQREAQQSGQTMIRQNVLNNLVQQNIRNTQENNRFEGDREFTEATIRNITESVTENVEETNIDTRNSIEQQLYQTNLQNVERQQNYIRNLAQLVERYESESTPMTMERMRNDGIEALQHPEVFNRRMEEEARTQEERRQAFEEAAEELLPESTREVFTMIREYLKEPERFAGTGAVAVNDQALLYLDSAERDVVREIPVVTDRVTELTERVTEQQRVTKQLIEHRPSAQPEEYTVPNTLRFAHRVEETTIDDETISQIQQHLRRNEQTTQTLSEEVKNIESRTERTINNFTNEIINSQDTETYKEQASVDLEPRQINAIAEKVYSRIERQLSNERRRRGL